MVLCCQPDHRHAAAEQARLMCGASAASAQPAGCMRAGRLAVPSTHYGTGYAPDTSAYTSESTTLSSSTSCARAGASCPARYIGSGACLANRPIPAHDHMLATALRLPELAGRRRHWGHRFDLPVAIDAAQRRHVALSTVMESALHKIASARTPACAARSRRCGARPGAGRPCGPPRRRRRGRRGRRARRRARRSASAPTTRSCACACSARCAVRGSRPFPLMQDGLRGRVQRAAASGSSGMHALAEGGQVAERSQLTLLLLGQL